MLETKNLLAVSILKNMLLLGYSFQLFSIQEKCLKLNLNMLNWFHHVICAQAYNLC